MQRLIETCKHRWNTYMAQVCDPLYSPHILNALRQLMSWSSLQEPVSTLIKGHYEAFWMLTPFDYVIPDCFVVTNNVPSCVWDHSRAEDWVQSEAFQKILDGDYNLTVLSCLHYSVSFDKTAKHHKWTNCPNDTASPTVFYRWLLYLITNDNWTKYFTFRFLVHDADFKLNEFVADFQQRSCVIWFTSAFLTRC